MKFETIIKSALDKYESKKEKYGESWKEMSLTDLRFRLAQEVAEYNIVIKDNDTLKEEFQELLDIINCSLMLATAIVKEKTVEILKKLGED